MITIARLVCSDVPAQMGEAGYQAVRASYSLQAAAQQIQDSLCQVAGG